MSAKNKQEKRRSDNPWTPLTPRERMFSEAWQDEIKTKESILKERDCLRHQLDMIAESLSNQRNRLISELQLTDMRLKGIGRMP